MQITKQSITFLGMQAQYALSTQGTASTTNPFAVFFTTLNSPGGDHVWSLRLSGTSALTTTQISNLTIPYYEISRHGQLQPLQRCGFQVIPNDLRDPSSALLILTLPNADRGCDGIFTDFKNVLIHSNDTPTADPIELPVFASSILPLYRPDGALAGLVALDASNNLNFYPDATFSNPSRLLANVFSLHPMQEPRSGPISSISANPSYTFLMVWFLNGTPGSGGQTVYRVDYTGSISGRLYDLPEGAAAELVDSDNLYFTRSRSLGPGVIEKSVGRIPGDGTPIQILGTASADANDHLPYLQGVSGSHLVFLTSATQSQWTIQTLPTDTPGMFTTIASSGGSVPALSFASGDLFVTWKSDAAYPSSGPQFSTEILDSSGNVLQAYLPSSFFASNRVPMIQVRNISDPSFLGGGNLYAVDLSKISSPTPVTVKTPTGRPAVLPTGADELDFTAVTSTISVSDGIGINGEEPSTALVYDQSKGVIVPVSIPNSTFRFLLPY
jgi:hypothetical protein